MTSKHGLKGVHLDELQTRSGNVNGVGHDGYGNSVLCESVLNFFH